MTEVIVESDCAAGLALDTYTTAMNKDQPPMTVVLQKLGRHGWQKLDSLSEIVYACGKRKGERVLELLCGNDVEFRMFYQEFLCSRLIAQKRSSGVGAHDVICQLAKDGTLIESQLQSIDLYWTIEDLYNKYVAFVQTEKDFHLYPGLTTQMGFIYPIDELLRNAAIQPWNRGFYHVPGSPNQNTIDDVGTMMAFGSLTLLSGAGVAAILGHPFLSLGLLAGMGVGVGGGRMYIEREEGKLSLSLPEVAGKAKDIYNKIHLLDYIIEVDL